MIALVQSQGGNSGGYVNSFAITIATAVTAGSFLSLVLTAGSADVAPTVSDNRGNAYLLDANSIGNERQTFVYHVDNAVAGSTVITITYASGTFPDSTYSVREFSGVQTTPTSLDKIATANVGTSYSNSHPSGTTSATAQADELVIAAIGSSGSTTPLFVAPSGYTGLITQDSVGGFTFSGVAYKIVSSIGTQSGTWTSTEYVLSQNVIATYKAAAGAVPNPFKRFDGTTFVASVPKRWNGTAWVDIVATKL